ncbi:hypothetical protein HP567_028745 [Brevibacillus sp. M2.1A]|uniref:hypothetical protein n=1 Tax=Brevibacillus sp. M2.1A TaxID=2738980 RepID=UPI00156BBDCE|nr:hypothetical protein [Brevibacillus sp. M2.1A]MCC8438527.1 hypothetical protein [Brevibacillus sp. M2.1A]
MQQQLITWIQAIFSGIGVFLLSGLFKQGIGPLAFFMASREENLFIGKTLRFIQRIVREIILVGISLVYFTGMFNVDIKKQPILKEFPYVSDIFYRVIFSIPTYVVLVVCLSLFLFFIFNTKFRNTIFKKSKPEKRQGKKKESAYFKGTFLVISVYIGLVSILCGQLLNLLLIAYIGGNHIDLNILHIIR